MSHLGGSFSTSNITLAVGVTPTPVGVTGIGALAESCADAYDVSVELSTSGDATGVGISLSTSARPNVRRGRIEYINAVGSKLNVRLLDEYYPDAQTVTVNLGVRVTAKGDRGPGQLHMSNSPLTVTITATAGTAGTAGTIEQASPGPAPHPRPSLGG